MDKMSSLISRSSYNKLYIILSGSAIFIGGLIYILLRPSEHLFFGWIHLAGLDQWISPARSLTLPISQLFPDWFIYSLPNGLWAFAYALLITRIWSDSNSWLKFIWMASIPTLVLGFEMLQYPGIIPGTFSLPDVVFGVFGMALGYITGSLKTKNNNYHEKAFE